MQYTLNQRLFLVKQYWITNSITATQRAYQRKFGVRNPPKRNTILGLVNKLETTGSLVSEKGKNRSSRLPTVVVDVRARQEQSPKKSLRRLSQETGYTYSMCQRAAKSAGLKPYRVTVVHQLQEPDKDERLNYCRLQNYKKEYDVSWLQEKKVQKMSDEILLAYVGGKSHEGPRPTSRLLASRPHAEAEVDDHPTRMEPLTLLGREFQSRGTATVKEDEYEDDRWGGNGNIEECCDRVSGL
ncbi:hypothetical protein ANN_25634 [Periplaneta americana]|uniref:DUF4817 domain-containing protein n=1 Tax=Periplaneta americana TaxID=6978 RepID=A0ABQ8S1R1_PERAM|nr:hypothetical protein ANN_25634 [Periplaneta americana]